MAGLLAASLIRRLSAPRRYPLFGLFRAVLHTQNGSAMGSPGKNGA
jgi:hypothetical protein